MNLTEKFSKTHAQDETDKVLQNHERNEQTS